MLKKNQNCFGFQTFPFRELVKNLPPPFPDQSEIDTINMYAVVVVRYSAGFVNWTKEDLDNLDQRIRKLMTMHSAYHPKAYPPRAKGGRGLIRVTLRCGRKGR